MKVLVTRPEPEATTLADRLRAEGLEVTVAPLFTIEGIELGEIPEANALLLTSPRSVAFVPPEARALPVYAVGGTTAEAARSAGLILESIGGGEADERLVTLVEPGTRLLHIAGEDIARDLGPSFSQRGITYHRLTAYRAAAVSELPIAAKDFLASDGDKLVTLLSVRAAETFAQLVTAAGFEEKARQISAVCFGPRVVVAATNSLPYRSVGETPPGNLTAFVDFVSSGGT